MKKNVLSTEVIGTPLTDWYVGSVARYRFGTSVDGIEWKQGDACVTWDDLGMGEHGMRAQITVFVQNFQTAKTTACSAWIDKRDARRIAMELLRWADSADEFDIEED